MLVIFCLSKIIASLRPFYARSGLYVEGSFFILKRLRHSVREYDCKNALFEGKERKGKERVIQLSEARSLYVNDRSYMYVSFLLLILIKSPNSLT